MRLHFVLICILTIRVRLNLAVIIVFASSPPSGVPIMQRIETHDHPDVCGIPLDLDVMDGRGYGWFGAEQVAFTELASTNSFTAVYGRAHQQPCSSEMIAHHIGNREWQTGILLRGGAGSALVVTSFRPMFGRRRYPDSVFVGEKEYNFLRMEATGVFWYWSRQGGVISGRAFENFVMSPTANTTALAASLLGTPESHAPV
ncbi:MAG: hypothetical protein Q9201_006050 [Fulgogasparrea decipioides]